MEDFRGVARYGQLRRTSRDVFEVHFSIAEGVDSEPAKSGLSSNEFIPSVIDVKKPDNHVDSSADDSVDTPYFVDAGDQSSANVGSIVADAIETTAPPAGTATMATQEGYPSTVVPTVTQDNAQDSTGIVSSNPAEQETLAFPLKQPTQIMAQATGSVANANRSPTPARLTPPALDPNEIVPEDAGLEEQQDDDHTVTSDANDGEEENGDEEDGQKIDKSTPPRASSDPPANVQGQASQGADHAHSSSAVNQSATNSITPPNSLLVTAVLTDNAGDPSNGSAQGQPDDDEDTFISNASEEDQALSNPTIKYYQVGYFKRHSPMTRGEIPMTYSAVAEVVRATSRSIHYQLWPTYDINDTLVGDYENNIGVPSNSHLWQDFVPNGYCKKSYDEGRLRELILQKDEQEADGRTPPYHLNAPCITTPTDEEFTSTTKPMKPTAPNKLIKAVIVINNRSSRLPAMVWDDNIQGDLEQTDDFAEVYKWVVKLAPVRGGSTGQSLTDALNSVNHTNWNVELWVIPQDSQRTQWTERSPYQWKAQSGLVARDWLDEKVWERHKSLYIEVHIVDRPAAVSS